jgi:hypothetical protein
MLTISPHHRAIQQYYDELRGYDAQGATHEGATSTAFQNLLANLAKRPAARRHPRPTE